MLKNKVIIPTVAILVYRNGEVLLVKNKEESEHLLGAYCLPAGRVEAREKEVEAAERELREKTGLKTKIENLFEIPIYYEAKIPRRNGSTQSMSMKVFLCKKYDGEIKNCEETFPEWVKISEIKKYPLLPNVEKTVLDGLKYR